MPTACLTLKRLIWIVALAALLAPTACQLGAQPTSAPPIGAPATRAPTSALPPSPTPVPTATPSLEVSASASPAAITFALRGTAPGAQEALLWYDTVAGRRIRRIPLSATGVVNASVTIDPTRELTQTQTVTNALSLALALDYWWAVRGAEGVIARRSDTLALPPSLAPLIATTPVTAPEPLVWTERATTHFRLYAPPGTAAERDLGQLAGVAEAGYQQAAALLEPTEPVSIPVYLVPRVFWQGGVAYGADGIVISYLDRNYAGVELWSYFVHEVAHVLGAYLVPGEAEVGGLLGEGVAVYVTGGHYGREPIDAWAAALAASDRYVPLCHLRYDFYAAQHEIAYLEGASFAGFLIRTYGPEVFKQIYRAQIQQRGDQQPDREAFCAADDQRVVEPAGETYAALERAWLDWLETLDVSDEQRRSWELTIRFFELMRRYQEELDPPARELPPHPAKWDRATMALFLNPAMGRRAATFETMLATAGPAIRRGEVVHAAALLEAIEFSLDAGGAPATPLARDYDAIAALIETQARALRMGDAEALARTLTSPGLAGRMPFSADDLLHDLRYELAALDVRGNVAEGVVVLWGESMTGRRIANATYRARFNRAARGWVMIDWMPYAPRLELPPGPGLSS